MESLVGDDEFVRLCAVLRGRGVMAAGGGIG